MHIQGYFKKFTENMCYELFSKTFNSIFHEIDEVQGKDHRSKSVQRLMKTVCNLIFCDFITNAMGILNAHGYFAIVTEVPLLLLTGVEISHW